MNPTTCDTFQTWKKVSPSFFPVHFFPTVFFCSRPDDSLSYRKYNRRLLRQGKLRRLPENLHDNHLLCWKTFLTLGIYSMNNIRWLFRYSTIGSLPRTWRGNTNFQTEKPPSRLTSSRRWVMFIRFDPSKIGCSNFLLSRCRCTASRTAAGTWVPPHSSQMQSWWEGLFANVMDATKASRMGSSGMVGRGIFRQVQRLLIEEGERDLN